MTSCDTDHSQKTLKMPANHIAVYNQIYTNLQSIQIYSFSISYSEKKCFDLVIDGFILWLLSDSIRSCDVAMKHQ